MAKISEPLAQKITVGDKQLEFEEDVAVVIEFEDRSIILLESDDIDEKDSMAGRNVLCFSRDGEMLWWIEGAEMTIGENDTPQSFLALYLDSEGRIKAGNPDASFCIKPEEGTLYDGVWKFR